MQITLITNGPVSAFSTLEKFDDRALAFEILRQEMSAQGSCLRRVFLDHCRHWLSRWPDRSFPEVDELADALIQAGDFSEGENGFIAAAPLRLIPIAAKKIRLIGALPTERLQETGAATLSSDGLIRHLEGEKAPEIASALEALGARSISAEAWAGLDAALQTGGDFLAALSDGLEASARLPAGDHPEFPQPWQAYQPVLGKTQAQRWTVPSSPGTFQLWRTFTIWKRPVFAWTSGSSPRDCEWFPVPRDQAIRAQFSLDRNADAPIAISIQKRKRQITVDISAFLPRAEFRYLQIMGSWEPPTPGKKFHRFVFDANQWPAISSKLSEHLGLNFEGGTHENEA